jgi:hypothetical protein
MSEHRSDSCGSGRRRGQHHRHRARKERVLHTRVSENLAADIRRIADDLRVPASNLVRNVLEEVFDVVESVTDDVGLIFDEVFEEADAARGRLQKRRGARRSGGDHRAWDAARAEVDEAEGGGAQTPPPPPVEWHVVDKDRSIGPRDQAWLRREVLAGRLGRDTLVWCAGLSDWQPAGKVPALADLFAPPPVPGTPPPPEASAEE